MSKRLLVAAVALVAAMAGSGVAIAGTTTASHQGGGGFVTRDGAQLKLDGKRFQFSGSNNYYLMYKSRLMVDDVFADAKAAGFTVLRTWGFLDIGNADGTNSVGSGPADGVYFQYWNGDRPAYNDGANGLERLDYVLYAAKQAGIKLIIPLTNNWNDFGGIDQYVRWRGGSFHDDFYTDAVIRGWYKDWISHVLNRVNTLTGVAYKDDPTVMTWELGNEPRCLSAGAYPRSPNCTTSTLVTWADEMTRHIKSVDRKHLASVGDEGFFCDDTASTDWTTSCGEGVDTLAFTRLPAVDVMSYHLYPDGWGKDLAWTEDWIKRHIREARRIGKPSMLGEFGFRDKATRNPVYQRWTDLVDSGGGDGWLYWILSGVQDDGALYPDFDGFTVYCPSPVCTNLTNAGKELSGPQRSRPPVADHDTVVTEFNQAATLSPAANDIAYRTSVRPASIDLDPATAGQQKTLAVAGGQFTLGANGVVTFAPVEDFVGRALARYTIRDLAARTSNVADLTVTVKPDPTGALPIASFETDNEGWHSINNLGGAIAVQTNEYATNGSFSLRVDTTVSGGDWFGVNLPASIDLTGKSMLKYDLRTNGAGTSLTASLQVGSGFVWCQWPFGEFLNGGQTRTVELDLNGSTACGVDLQNNISDVRAIWIWVAGAGVFEIDNVRAE